MNATVYDRLARALLRLAPGPVLAWLLAVAAELRFVRWVDAHLGSPEAAERTADALAHVANDADGGRPWLLAAESQTRPDPEMFGRLLEYLGAAWRREKPSDLPGDRFAVAAIVINLTGVGNSFPVAAWPAAGLRSGELGREVNLCQMDADNVLDQVAAGTAPAAVLGFIPLMKRGGEVGIIQRWVELADKVTDRRARAVLAGVTAFAELTDCRPVWERVLMAAFPFTESPFINECIEKVLPARVDAQVAERTAELAREHKAQLAELLAEKDKQRAEAEKQRAEAEKQRAEAEKRLDEAKVRAILNILRARLGPLPGEAELARQLAPATRQAPDRFDDLTRLAVQAASLDDFRRDAGL